MGTRHLVCVTLDGAFKVAQYGQWDGYPEGQGKSVLAFAAGLSKSGLESFKTSVRALKALTGDEVKTKWVECGADPQRDSVPMNIAEEFGRRYPALNRDTGAKVLVMILDGSCKAVRLQPEFGADSLFCEWAYNLDLDAGEFEVFKGFQKKPHQLGRFAAMKSEERDNGYVPVAKVAGFPLSALPTEDDFLSTLTEKEEAAS